jgi:hypothetical protein
MHQFQQKSFFGPYVEGVTFFFASLGVIFLLVFLAMQIGLLNVRGSISERNAFFTASHNDPGARELAIQKIVDATDKNLETVRMQVFPDIDFSWLQSSEWQTLKVALVRDRQSIERAANDAGISPRVLVSVVIAEQLRFFTSDRESFKKFFEPLKILGTLSQFSLGISGVKPETALQVEKNLVDINSPFYINDPTGRIQKILIPTGEEAQKYSGTTTDALRFDRLTDSHNHYYSYLYTALFIRQVSEQWQKAGYDISNRPEILATLFNLGFDKSVPKSEPKAAGSIIEINGIKYTFGELAFAFYYSGELATVFGY